LDLAIHTGELRDNHSQARDDAGGDRRVARVSREARQAVEAAERAEHHCVIFAPFGAPLAWRFAGPMRHVPAGSLRSHDAETLRAAALGGLGVAFAPGWLFAHEIATRQVTSILRRFAPPPLAISAVHPPGRRVPTRVRLFTDFVAKLLKRRAG
jgi:DNA-binding transcriptional LysR family regulator